MKQAVLKEKEAAEPRAVAPVVPAVQAVTGEVLPADKEGVQPADPVEQAGVPAVADSRFLPSQFYS